jgi:hypothetical protein
MGERFLVLESSSPLMSCFLDPSGAVTIDLGGTCALDINNNVLMDWAI